MFSAIHASLFVSCAVTMIEHEKASKQTVCVLVECPILSLTFMRVRAELRSSRIDFLGILARLHGCLGRPYLLVDWVHSYDR